MRRIKSYKTFERALPDSWLEDNPDNYLAIKISPPDGSGLRPRVLPGNSSIVDKLKNISWKDIDVEPGYLSPGDVWHHTPGKRAEYYLCRYGDLNIIRFAVHSSNLNRIHTDTAMPDEYRNMGLGYKCYKAVISKVGWVRSDEDGTNKNSRSIWRRLIKDNDYYAFGISIKEDHKKTTNNGFVVIKKSKNKKRRYIKEVIKRLESEGYSVTAYDPYFK